MMTKEIMNQWKKNRKKRQMGQFVCVCCMLSMFISGGLTRNSDDFCIRVF